MNGNPFATYIGVAEYTLPPRCSNKDYKIRLPAWGHPGEPENCRVSAARAERQRVKRQFSQTPVRFWFRTRYISALGQMMSSEHPHILQLHLAPSAVAWLISRFTRLLPGLSQSWVERFFPERFLPSNVILKSEKRQDGENGAILRELFDTEVKAYNRLKPIQGVVVPRCYGIARFNGDRALVLERLGGVSLASPEGSTLKLEELSELLQSCYRALHAFGVHYDDPHPINFQLVDGKIMALDFERVSFDLSTEDNELFMKLNVEDLASRYRRLQVYFWRGGLLEAARYDFQRQLMARRYSDVQLRSSGLEDTYLNVD